MVINDGYLAQVPGGAGAHLHNTDRYNTALQDQTGQVRPAADWRVADRCDECHRATPNHCDIVVAAWFNQLEYKLFHFFLPPSPFIVCVSGSFPCMLPEHRMKEREDPLAEAR